MKTNQSITQLLIIFHFSFFIISLMSCSPQHKLQRLEDKHPELFTPVVKDSVGVKTYYRNHDSIIIIPGETVTSTITLPCPQAISHKLSAISHKNGITATLTIDSGKVSVICHEDSLKQELHFRDKIIDSIKVRTRMGIAMHNVYKTHWYDIFFRCWFALTFGCILCWLCVSYLKHKAVV